MLSHDVPPLDTSLGVRWTNFVELKTIVHSSLRSVDIYSYIHFQGFLSLQ